MEFFLPGLFLFLVSLAVTALVAPKVTPAVATVLAIGFLTYGVYHHQKLFAAEYRLSTWQEGLKVYAPALMILAVLLFLFYAILAFFTGGRVPVPAMNLSLPSPDSFTNSVATSFNAIGNSVATSFNTLGNSMGNLGNSLNFSGNGNQGNQNKGNKGNISRSFLETV
jgi:hypothetical protein